MVVGALAETALVGLDMETTGLDAHRDRARLLSLDLDTCDGGRHTYLLDLFALAVDDLAPVWAELAAKEVIAHNAGFDLGFLARLGFVPGARVHDTLMTARLLAAGTRRPCDLESLAASILEITLDKTHQTADWSGALTPDRLAYAARDAAVLLPLYRRLKDAVETAGLAAVLDIEERCVPAVVWLADAGVPFDAAAWRALADGAERDVRRLKQDLDRVAGPLCPTDLFGTAEVNWDSPPQIQSIFTAAGIAVTATRDDALASVDHPLAATLRDYRAARKRTSAYGEKFLAHARPDGRVYPRWNQLGADSGRMSASAPNMQQLPRGKEYRACVRAPAGRVLVKADYSQIELRIAAKVADEARMIAAYREGADLHTLTAKRVLGLEAVTTEQRQLAKALNFGLLYGMGARGFRQYAKAHYDVDLTDDQATRYRESFFAAYPGLRSWHRAVGNGSAKETRTLTGRRVLFAKPRFNDMLNSPVQGTGADGLKLALALLWERREEVSGAVPVLAVHDEIVVECDVGPAESVAAWLKQAMVDAMAPLVDPVPVGVEVQVAQTWGG
jgi:DNA polymerase-1